MRDPTPEEIQQRAAEIRKGWSPQEEQRRRVTPNNPVELREYSLGSRDAKAFSDLG